MKNRNIILGTQQNLKLKGTMFTLKKYINENCHNSRTSHNIVMKLETVNKPDKKNMTSLYFL